MRVEQVELRSVRKSLGGERVLKGVDAVLERGVVHVLRGSNGSGKSTLLRIVGGHLRADGGAVAFVGRERVEDAPDRRMLAGWLGHEVGLYVDLTVRENLLLAAGLRGLAPAAVERELEESALLPFADRRVREVSRGQRQRVALARLWLGANPVLLLDEPTTGLDDRAVTELRRRLDRVVEEGALVVLVTHDGRSLASAPREWRVRSGLLMNGSD